MAWNGSGNTNGAQPRPAQPTPTKKAPSALKGIVAGVVVVVLAAVAFFVLTDTGKHPAAAQKEKKPAKIATVKTEYQPKASKPIERTDESTEKTGKSRYHTNRLGHVEYRAENGKLITITNKYLIAALNSNTPGVEAPHLMQDPNKPKMFKNDLQGELLEFTRPGAFVQLSQDYTDKEALEMARQGIEYSIEEEYSSLEQKKAVEDLCKELTNYIEQGGHAKDFFAELQARQNLECETLQTVKSEVMALCHEGRESDAQIALDKYNAYLKGKGLPAVEMNHQMRMALKRGKMERGEQ